MYVFICLFVVKLDTSVLWVYDQLAVLPALYNATLENSCRHTDRTIHVNVPYAIDYISSKL